NHLRNFQISTTPVFFSIGFETRLFYGKPAITNWTENKMFGHMTIPFGLRYMIRPMNKLVLVPELMFNYNLWTSRTKNEGAFEDRSTYLSLGANARWTIFHAGLGYNMGSTVRFLGF